MSTKHACISATLPCPRPQPPKPSRQYAKTSQPASTPLVDQLIRTGSVRLSLAECINGCAAGNRLTATPHSYEPNLLPS